MCYYVRIILMAYDISSLLHNNKFGKWSKSDFMGSIWSVSGIISTVFYMCLSILYRNVFNNLRFLVLNSIIYINICTSYKRVTDLGWPIFTVDWCISISVSNGAKVYKSFFGFLFLFFWHELVRITWTLNTRKCKKNIM